MHQCVHWTTTWTQNDPTWFIYWSPRLQKHWKTQRFFNISIFGQCRNLAAICVPTGTFVDMFGAIWDPFFFHPSLLPLRLFQLFQSLYHVGVFWSILDHLEPTLAKYGTRLGSILVHLGPFWIHWGRTWNKSSYILNDADENLAFWNFLKHRAPDVSQHE